MHVDVVFTLTGDIRWNSRALKQLRLISGLGYSVYALGIADKSTGIQQGEGITIRTLKRPAGSGPRFFKRVHALMKEASGEVRASVYHASDLYTLPAQATIARKHGAKLVYDARELYPHVASTSGRPWVRWFWQAIERRYAKQAHLVSTVSPSIADRMTSTYRIERPVILYNVPEFKEVQPTTILRDALSIPAEVPVILHQGNVQKDRGCFLLARAMEQVEGAVLVFLGGGPLRTQLKEVVEQEGLSQKVRFMARVDPSILLDYTASADIGVTLLEDTCLNHRFALPNKLFEYFMAGLPVVASNLPEIKRVIEQFNTGLVVDPSNVNSVAEGLRTLVEQASLRKTLAANTAKVFETFNWEQASEEYVSRYKDLLSH